MLISYVFEVLEHRWVEVSDSFLLNFMTLDDLYCLLLALLISYLQLLQSFQKMNELLSALAVSWWSDHVLDSARRSTWEDSLDLESIAGQMSCTLAAIIETFPINLYFEFSFTIKVVDTPPWRHGHSPFGDSSTVGDWRLIYIGINAILLHFLPFLINLFELILIVPFDIFFIVVSLSDRRVVDLTFIGQRSDYLSEERFLNISDSIHNC